MNLFFYRLFRFLGYSLRQWLKRRFTPLGVGVLVFVIISGLVGLDTQRSLSYQVFALACLLLVVSIVAIAFSRPRFQVRRLLPRFGTVGLPLPYRVTIQNTTPKNFRKLRLIEAFAHSFPSFEDYLDISRPRKGRNQAQSWGKLIVQAQRAIAPAVGIPVLAAQAMTEIKGEITPLRRGLLQFETMTLACPDPLGIFNACIRLPLPQSVLILPKRYPVPSFQLPERQWYQPGGLSLALSVGESEEFWSLRDYRPGDSPRKVHWKSWAKLGKPVVREEQAEYFVHHALVLDTFQPESFSEILEEAISVAASLACEMQNQESLLDLIFSGLGGGYVTLGRGLGQTERILELLASVVPCQDQPFDSLLPIMQNRLPLFSSCICILLTWDEARQTLVKQLQSANIPTWVLILTRDRHTLSPMLEDYQSHLMRVYPLPLGHIQPGLQTICNSI
ncbi:conserved repeat protein [Leptolyngbya sp. Heron Island J]|uniref:DUF58 domain-containing protein n=1 Tax=Leptolyngbya sp. Heron Island J TaxID=1385935 RepID=UPI0003B964D6|nr:DUF58 domain-containing protein [Leptolyngbya sp. Heron Island J]ESA36970.1 conserved repeat protein [Leptolyngbya sp. Heron Island J]